MKKEWLDDYEKHEMEEYKKFIHNFKQQPFNAVNSYYISSRFKKTNHPNFLIMPL
jgi:hypothetical protein